MSSSDLDKAHGGIYLIQGYSSTWLTGTGFREVKWGNFITLMHLFKKRLLKFYTISSDNFPCAKSIYRLDMYYI